MKDEGFTLIELLAVIVILAIIALIAVPIILGIISDAKKQSNQRSAELYLKAAELAIARKNLTTELGDTECTVQGDGNLMCGTTPVTVEVDGEVPNAGAKITFSSGKITKIQSFKLGDTKYKLQNGSLKVDDSSENEENSENEETFTGTIYRNSSDPVKIGDSIEVQTKNVYCGIIPGRGNSCDLLNIGTDTNEECVSVMADFGMPNATCEEGTITTGLTPGSYYTEETKSNITQNFYLKHEVEDNIVTASYACLKYSEDEEPACVQGGPDAIYGSFDGMTEGMTSQSDVHYSNPTGNIAILDTISYFEPKHCYFRDTYSNCGLTSLYINAYASGFVHASNDSIVCAVFKNGLALCFPNM